MFRPALSGGYRLVAYGMATFQRFSEAEICRKSLKYFRA